MPTANIGSIKTKRLIYQVFIFAVWNSKETLGDPLYLDRFTRDDTPPTLFVLGNKDGLTEVKRWLAWGRSLHYCTDLYL